MADNFTKNRVVAAMSGGVDSSVAAARLVELGMEVIGITLNLSCATNASDRSCCSLAAAQDAKKVADQLGIPHYTLNFKDEFQKLVIDDFIEEYKNGRTPNPCVRCNQFIKFDQLLKKAKELGAEYVATGHYARIQPLTPFSPSPLSRGKGIGERGYQLLKGKDPKKDQSYVLYRLTQEQLAHTLFPLGEMTKEVVRKKARELKLPVAEKEESQDICFVEDDDYGRFLKKKIPEAVKPGPILDQNGKQIGEHEGILFYTVGQRKGIGAHGERKYVTALDPQKNAVIIGEEADLYKSEVAVKKVSFVSGKPPGENLDISAKIRYNSPASPAELVSTDEVKVKFKSPQRAVTPGQSVVFYQGEEVLGGGIISGGW
ncbi:tRNA 2-thiouridine(34) synthase MnmA [Candidatus Saganbacteria bacterium]|nr:tRNA 2-thiouridine(34) synthase MnmA [Candidatus Saganbacteria bacterium]